AQRVRIDDELPVMKYLVVHPELDRASRGWRGSRGLTMTPNALRLLQDPRRQLVHPPITPEVITEAVTAAP
ncbi:MAG TPA: hypothetical protein VKA57_09985, partial [Solirubrobacteraceae bacterium]|nr:hypothetical protein [Solirubrobacteraceae bacterium]